MEVTNASPLDAVVGHLGDRFAQHRMPVAVAPVDRQRRAVGVQPLRDQRHQQARDLIARRAYAAESLIVRGHFQQPLPRHVLAADDVFQERHHVLGTFRAAERDQQQGVIGRQKAEGGGRKGGQGKAEGGRLNRSWLSYSSDFIQQGQDYNRVIPGDAARARSQVPERHRQGRPNSRNETIHPDVGL